MISCTTSYRSHTLCLCGVLNSYRTSLLLAPPPSLAARLHPDIVDIKPANMEDLTEIITAAEFHPHQCNTFVYSSSKGSIRLCDMRASALCDQHTKRACHFLSLGLELLCTSCLCSVLFFKDLCV